MLKAGAHPSRGRRVPKRTVTGMVSSIKFTAWAFFAAPA